MCMEMRNIVFVQRVKLLEEHLVFGDKFFIKEGPMSYVEKIFTIKRFYKV